MDMISGQMLFFSMIIGMVMPFIVSFLKKETWPVKVKHAISIVVTFVAAIIVTVFGGGAHITTWAEFVANFGVIFATANVLYTQFFKDTVFEKFFADRGIK